MIVTAKSFIIRKTKQALENNNGRETSKILIQESYKKGENKISFWAL